MATVNNANVVFKDKDGNIGYIKTFSTADIALIQANIQGLKDLKDRVDVIIDDNGAFTNDAAATASTTGVVQLADAAAVTAGTAGRVVDAAQLKAVADKLTNGVHYKGTVATYTDLPSTDVEAGDMYNVTAAFTKDGVDYPAGTNVIADTSGASIEWDVLDGDPSGFAKQAVANTFTAQNTFTGAVVVNGAADFTGGSIAVPTQTAGDNTTAAASTAFVKEAVDNAIEGVVKYSSSTPAEASLEANTATFYPAENLLTAAS